MSEKKRLTLYPMTKKRAIIIAVTALLASFIIGGIVGQANAQTVECIGDDTGGVDPKHSAVKKPGDPVTISWVAPTCDTSGDPLEGATALTGFELYVSVNQPITPELGPVVFIPADQLSVTVTADAQKGEEIYYALRAVNDFGKSVLSTQRWVKLPGNPQGAASLDAK